MAVKTLVFELLAKDKAGPVFDDLSKKVDSTAGRFSKWKTAGVGALAAVGGGMIKIGKDGLDAFKETGGETLKLQRLMGGTAEEASRMRFAFAQSGIGADAAATSMGAFSKKIVENTSTLGDLGIKATDATGKIRPMGELLPELAEKFKRMPAGAEKTALAMQLFEDAGADLLPFLNKGKAGIDELTKASDKYGMTLSGPQLDALKANKTAQREWETSIQGVKLQIGAALMPTLNQLITSGRKYLIPMLQSSAHFLTTNGETIVRFGAAALPVIGTLAAWHKAQSMLNTVMNMSPVMRIATAVLALGSALFSAYKSNETFRNAVDKGWQVIMGVIRFAWNNVIAPTLRFFASAIETLVGWVASLLEGLSNIPGFGWASDAAVKLRGAGKAAGDFGKNIKDIPEYKAVNVSVNVLISAKQVGAMMDQQARKAAAHKLANYAIGGRPRVGVPSVVGEAGRELFFPDVPGTVVPAHETAQILAGRGRGVGSGQGADGEGELLPVNLVIDGEVLVRTLVKLKRRKGGVSLGIA